MLQEREKIALIRKLMLILGDIISIINLRSETGAAKKGLYGLTLEKILRGSNLNSTEKEIRTKRITDFAATPLSILREITKLINTSDPEDTNIIIVIKCLRNWLPSDCCNIQDGKISLNY